MLKFGVEVEDQVVFDMLEQKFDFYFLADLYGSIYDQKAGSN